MSSKLLLLMRETILVEKDLAQRGPMPVHTEDPSERGRLDEAVLAWPGR
jgi:hypothetical protein